jgi:hypothetical protein
MRRTHRLPPGTAGGNEESEPQPIEFASETYSSPDGWRWRISEEDEGRIIALSGGVFATEGDANADLLWFMGAREMTVNHVNPSRSFAPSMLGIQPMGQPSSPQTPGQLRRAAARSVLDENGKPVRSPHFREGPRPSTKPVGGNDTPTPTPTPEPIPNFPED